MGITYEKVDVEEDVVIDEDTQKGTYYIGFYSLQWLIDLSSNTVTLNLRDGPDLGTKVITRENSDAEYRVDEPHFRRLNVKISGNFDSKQLLLNGWARYYYAPRKLKTKVYENVILTSW